MADTLDNINAGPSTPSRKRSKWDDAEIEDAHVLVNPTKKRVKPKGIVPTDIGARNGSNRPSTVNAGYQSRPTIFPHSRFVPQRTAHPPLLPSRSVYSYERLNQIEEGSYGVVFRARDKQTGDIVALKKLKLDEEKHGFPITALREINALIACRHENVVKIREVVVGETLTQ